MKKCITLLLGLSSMHALFTQTTTLFSQCIRVDASLGYTMPADNSVFNDLVGPLGFGAGMDYCIGGKHLKFMASPFVFLWQGKGLSDMKSYYKERDFTLNNYNSGSYFTSGVLMGFHYTFKTALPDKLPQFTAALQYGFTAANLPETEANYNSPDESGIIKKTTAGKGVGTGFRLQLGADVLRTNNTTYNIGLSLRRDAADIPMLVTSNVSTPTTEIFAWRTTTIQLHIGAAFSLD